MLPQYTTLADIQFIITNDIRESLRLEYKSSDVIVKPAIPALCKVVSAFANSAGGIFVTGIISANGKPVSLDNGGPSSKIDWIHQIINANTFPSIEAFDVQEITGPSGSYYVIDVPVSPNAPHQTQDLRYYKRRGPHSEPMEHYEIEDVRSRPKYALAPLRVDLISKNIIAILRITNDSETDPITDVECNITTNCNLDIRTIKKLNLRGLRQLGPKVEMRFWLDSFVAFLNGHKEPEVQVNMKYLYRDAPKSFQRTFFLADYEGSSIPEPAVSERLGKMNDKIDELVKGLAPLKGIVDILEKGSDGSGLRLSARTIQSLQGKEERFRISEYDYSGFQIVANLSLEEALQIRNIFSHYGSPDEKRAQYLQLPADLRARFESKFRADFDDG